MRALALLLLLSGPAFAAGPADAPRTGDRAERIAPPPPRNPFPADIMDRMRAALVALETPDAPPEPAETPAGGH